MVESVLAIACVGAEEYGRKTRRMIEDGLDISDCDSPRDALDSSVECCVGC